MHVQIRRGWEDWLAFFSAQLPDPVVRHEGEDALTFIAGEPPEVIVRLSPRTIDVAEVRVRNGASGFTIHPRWLGRVRWTRLPERRAIPIVEVLVATARELRHRTYITCAVCERETPPESMAGAETCVRCARADAPALGSAQ